MRRAHFILEIRASFRLISYWKRLDQEKSADTRYSPTASGSSASDIYSSPASSQNLVLTISDSNGQLFSGSAAPGSKVELFLSGSTIADFTTTAASNGRWQIVPDQPQDHNTTVRVQAIQEGDDSPYSQATTIVDALAEPISISLADDSGISNSDLITNNSQLNLENVEAGASVQYSIDGEQWLPNYAPVEGENTIYVRQVDPLGNISESRSLSFTLDSSTGQPAVSLETDTGHDDSDFITSVINLAISNLEADALVEYSIDGENWATSFTAIEGQIG